MKSDYNKRIESEIGYGGMHMGQGPGIREFNRLYKELDDLYHNLALRQGLSDSASIILYALYLLGDGCLQRDICDLSLSLIHI